MEGQRIGRYVLYDAIASGGMASVHFGRMVGPGGFARTVVIKRLHSHLVRDVEFAAMFLDEGHLAARIRHPNVVATIDVASLEGELLLVMEYVRGESLSRLLATQRARHETIPQAVVSSIILGVLYGLEAAHEAKTEQGAPLGIVHRDVSPQNVMVGADGLARVADFGVAKAASRSHSTRDGKIKGKLAYMSPEQIQRLEVDRRADIYGVGVILWEALAGRKLFVADDGVAVMHAVLNDPVPRLATVAPEVPDALDQIVAKALARRPKDRFASALEMAEALELASPPALQRQVGAWLLANAGEALAERDRVLAAVERSTPSDVSTVRPMRDSLVRLTEQPTALGGAAAPGAAPVEVTGLALSGEIVFRRRARRRGLFAALGLAGACATGFLLFRLVAHGSAGSNASATPADRPSAAVSGAVGATQTAASLASSPTPAATSGSEMSPGAGGDGIALLAPPPAGATSANPRTTRPPGRAQPRPSRIKDPRPASTCDPPFIVGSDGIERFKPGCL
jgi:hypothetical protein